MPSFILDPNRVPAARCPKHGLVAGWRVCNHIKLAIMQGTPETLVQQNTGIKIAPTRDSYGWLICSAAKIHDKDSPKDWVLDPKVFPGMNDTGLTCEECLKARGWILRDGEQAPLVVTATDADLLKLDKSKLRS